MIKAFFEIDTWNATSNELHVVCFPGDMQTIVPHWQASPEILLVLEGSLDVTINDQTHHLEQFDFITINSNEVHSTSDPGKNGTQIIFTVDAALFHDPGLRFCFSTVGEGAISADDPDACAARLCLTQICYANSSSHIQMPVEQACMDKWYMLRRWLYELMGIMSKHTVDSVMDNSVAPTALIDCLSVIHTDYKNQLTAEEVAKRAYISRAKLFRLFSTYLGVGFAEYVNMVRLQHTCAQLLENKSSIAEIAANNGFSSTSNFYSNFKRILNTTPQKYRANKKLDSSLQNQQKFRLLNEFERRGLNDAAYKKYISLFETISEYR